MQLRTLELLEDEGNKDFPTQGASGLHNGFMQVRKRHFICQVNAARSLAREGAGFQSLSPLCAGYNLNNYTRPACPTHPLRTRQPFCVLGPKQMDSLDDVIDGDFEQTVI